MSGNEPRRVSRKLLHTVVLVAVVLAAQAVIVALAPRGRAQTRVTIPPRISILISAQANVVSGGLWEPRMNIRHFPISDVVTYPASIVGTLGRGAKYFGVFSNQGQPSIDPSQGAYTMTLTAAPVGVPLLVDAFVGVDGAGLISETTLARINDFPLTFSRTLLSQLEPSNVQLSYVRPAVTWNPAITSVWTVEPGVNSNVITDTLVLGSLKGAVYESVRSNFGICQSTVVDFSCKFDELALGKVPGVISAVVSAAAPGSVQEALRVATRGNVDFVYTATSRVLPTDVSPLELPLDVKPFSAKNVVDLNRRWMSFALFSTPDLDVSEEVDRATIRFGRTGLEDSVRFCFRFDLSRDGVRDLFCLAHTEPTGFGPNDVQAVVTASTFDGRSARGTDVIQVVSP